VPISNWWKRFIVTLTGCLACATGAALSDNLATSTNTRRVALLELYTSEGCSSCPPADRWVSRLPRPFVPEKLVVLAFHVDYWNYIGWPDRFSQSRFTGRQRDVSRHNRLHTIYTPQLVLNGRDYRRSGSIESDVARINALPPGARLELRAARKTATIHVAVTAKLNQPFTEEASLYVALYENNLESDVKAGENRGSRLRHDYVVRTLIGPIPVSGNRDTGWSGDIPVNTDWKPDDLGIAAFVQSGTTGEVLQAASHVLPAAQLRRKRVSR